MAHNLTIKFIRLRFIKSLSLQSLVWAVMAQGFYLLRRDWVIYTLCFIRRISTSEIDLTTNYLFLQSLLITVANDKILALF